MPEPADTPVRIPKLGDRVKIRYSTGMKGRIVELRGQLGPGGAEVYRVRLANQPKPAYTEVLADQLIFLDDEE